MHRDKTSGIILKKAKKQHMPVNARIASNKRPLFTNATTRSCTPRLSSKFDISDHSRKSSRVHNKSRFSIED